MVLDEDTEYYHNKLLNNFTSKLEEYKEDLEDIMFSRGSTVDMLIELLVHIFDELYPNIKDIIEEINIKLEEKYEKTEEEITSLSLPIYEEGLPIICPHCHRNIVESIHHIIPKKYGGITTENNIISLCNKCHDLVEICTDELFKERKRNPPSLSELKFYIRYGFPNEEKIKEEMRWNIRK